jgi:predicted glycoside hydrolase/deacetylase ChbG (UPF0249 family)
MLAPVWHRLPSLPELKARACLGQLTLTALADELDVQWQVFVNAFGQAPAHLDGH